MYHHPSNSINGYNTPSTRQRTNSNNTRRSTSQQYPPSRPLQLEQILQNPSYQRSVFSILELRERRRNASSAASRPSPENEGTWQLDNAYSIREANRPENVDRNRWLGDLEPYDRTRVKFPPNEMGEERYLNANWVREVNGGRWWIAAQAPLPHTTHAFFSLCIPQYPGAPHVRTIIQLATLDGTRSVDPYIPEHPGENVRILPEQLGVGRNASTIPAIEVHLVKRKIFLPHCVKSTLRLITPGTSQYGGNGGRTAPTEVAVTHLLFDAWPDHSVPSTKQNQKALIDLIHSLDSVNRLSPYATSSNPDPPMIVHCSAGVGRTGTFIALCSLLRSTGLLPSPHKRVRGGGPPRLGSSPMGPLEGDFEEEDPVIREIDGLREQRMRMMEGLEQFKLLYQVWGEAVSMERDTAREREEEALRERRNGNVNGGIMGAGKRVRANSFGGVGSAGGNTNWRLQERQQGGGEWNLFGKKSPRDLWRSFMGRS